MSGFQQTRLRVFVNSITYHTQVQNRRNSRILARGTAKDRDGPKACGTRFAGLQTVATARSTDESGLLALPAASVRLVQRIAVLRRAQAARSDMIRRGRDRRNPSQHQKNAKMSRQTFWNGKCRGTAGPWRTSPSVPQVMHVAAGKNRKSTVRQPQRRFAPSAGHGVSSPMLSQFMHGP